MPDTPETLRPQGDQSKSRQPVDRASSERERVVEATIAARFITGADRLVPAARPSTKEPMLQVKALRERPSEYPERVPVTPGTTWDTIDRSSYHPTDFTSPSVLVEPRPAWADPEDPRQKEGYPNFPSYEGTVRLDADGRPLNPMGPTGLRGRGELGEWGANFAADPIVTRISDEGVLEMIAVQRSDSGQWAIPGGMVDRGERATATLKRELGEETAAHLDFEDARAIYQGGVDDRRNTDNARMETDAYHLHLPTGTEFAFQAQEGEALDVRWMHVTEREVDSLYASHAHFVRLAVQDWEQQAGFIVDKEGRVGRAARIDIEKLKRDHGLTPYTLSRVEQNVDFPDIFVVPTGTDLKPTLLSEVLTRAIGKPIAVEKVPAPSGVSEQPVGIETVTGANNRLTGAVTKVRAEQAGTESRFHDKKVGYVSNENGIFKGILKTDGLTLERLDQSQEFDPTASYYDAAVITIRLPNGQTVTKVSTPKEAVQFPKQDVLEAQRRGFGSTTVGSVIAERAQKEGSTIDKQDPHSYLTKTRPDGSFSRYQQLAGAIVDGFVELVSSTSPQ